jgi:hypothetical protein
MAEGVKLPEAMKAQCRGRWDTRRRESSDQYSQT